MVLLRSSKGTAKRLINRLESANRQKALQQKTTWRNE
jgi:hypothetical protein